MATVRVYFAHTARHAHVERNADTERTLRQLACRDGVYMASTERDYHALSAHVVDAMASFPWTCHAKPAALGRTCGYVNASGGIKHAGLVCCESCGATKAASDARIAKGAR